jgi:hypothetical protein
MKTYRAEKGSSDRLLQSTGEKNGKGCGKGCGKLCGEAMNNFNHPVVNNFPSHSPLAYLYSKPINN